MRIAHNGDIDSDIFTNLCRIDICMNNLRMRGKVLKITCYAIIKASTECNDEVTFLL